MYDLGGAGVREKTTKYKYIYIFFPIQLYSNKIKTKHTLIKSKQNTVLMI